MRLTPEQRLALIDHINALVQVDFERLVFALDAPRSVVPSNFAAQGDRSSALLVWVVSPNGCGMGQLLKSLGAIQATPRQANVPIESVTFESVTIGSLCCYSRAMGAARS